MTNVCKNCGETVIPDPDDGHCPNCNARDGYTLTKTLTLSHRIKNEKDEIQRTIDEKFKEYDRYINQGKNIEFYKKLKKSLEKQVPEFLAKAEENAKERLEYEEKERTQHKVSFTFGAVIGTEEQRKIKDQEDYIIKIENEKDQLKAQLETQKFIDEKLKETIEDTAKSVNTIKDRLSPKSTVTLSLVIGICGSLIASVLFKLWIDLQPQS